MTYIALGVGAVGILLLLSSVVLRKRARTLDLDRVEAALARGDRTAAIRTYREGTGAGLIEARDAVERIGRGNKAP
jgi:ribosomal protein L7/L12